MSYRLNGKNLSVGRLIVRGNDPKKAPPRMKHMIVTPKGSVVVTPSVVARVSLPEGSQFDDAGKPIGSRVYTQEELDSINRPASESSVEVQMPPGEPAVDGPKHMVPKLDEVFFTPTSDMPSFVVNADMLRKLLTVASEVCDDSEKVTRITFDKKANALRLDTYRQPGEQEFCAVMKCMRYKGQYIPGTEDVAVGLDPKGPKPEQQNLVLPVVAGRKFRGEGE